ncbi:MAG TPA: hypothetical protein DGG94_13010 [Micromonosporaceae bacterium]|nr:hypothetical protein [Micromonosporaceae bacterium]HCU50700.1 hypothetical protein [Micromonosporaceae bacterium]
MPGYLTIDIEHIRTAWEDSTLEVEALSTADLTVEEQLDYGRRAVAVHVPQSWPQGVFCRNCHARFPCGIAVWGMKLLRHRGWDLPDIVDLIEAVQAGEPQ